MPNIKWNIGRTCVALTKYCLCFLLLFVHLGTSQKQSTAQRVTDMDMTSIMYSTPEYLHCFTQEILLHFPTDIFIVLGQTCYSLLSRGKYQNYWSLP